MNHNVYIFGNLGAGYTQFPEDVTRSIFESSAKNRKSKVQITVKRANNLVYYIYTRLLDDAQGDKFIGIAISFNGVYINDIKPLFCLFDSLLTSIVIGGSFIEFSDDGSIVSKVVSIHSRQGEVSRIVDRIAEEIRHLDSMAFRNLPPENYAIAITEQINLNDDESPIVFDKAIKDYHILNLVRSDASGFDPLNSYSLKLKDLSNKLKQQQESYRKQSEELTEVKRQKKRTKAVTILSICIIVGFVVFLAIGRNLTDQVNVLTGHNNDLEIKVHNQNEEIHGQSQTISSYKEKVFELNRSLSEARDSIIVIEEIIESQIELIKCLQDEKKDLNDQLSIKTLEANNTRKKYDDALRDKDRYFRLSTERQTEINRLKQKIASLEDELSTYQSKKKKKK